VEPLTPERVRLATDEVRRLPEDVLRCIGYAAEKARERVHNWYEGLVIDRKIYDALLALRNGPQGILPPL